MNSYKIVLASNAAACEGNTAAALEAKIVHSNEKPQQNGG